MITAREVVGFSPLLYLAVAGSLFAIRDGRWAFWLALATFWTGILMPSVLNPKTEDLGWTVLIAGIAVAFAAVMGMLGRAVMLISPPWPRLAAMALAGALIAAPPAWLYGKMLLR